MKLRWKVINTKFPDEMIRNYAHDNYCSLTFAFQILKERYPEKRILQQFVDDEWVDIPEEYFTEEVDKNGRQICG